MKEFKKWCTCKTALNELDFTFPKNRDIWWVSLGVNIGHEQDGVGHLFERPVLVLKKFPNGTCFVIPLTKAGDDSKFYYKLFHDGKVSYLALTQGRVISNKRLNRHIRRLSIESFNKIKDVFKKIHSL